MRKFSHPLVRDPGKTDWKRRETTGKRTAQNVFEKFDEEKAALAKSENSAARVNTSILPTVVEQRFCKGLATKLEVEGIVGLG